MLETKICVRRHATAARSECSSHIHLSKSIWRKSPAKLIKSDARYEILILRQVTDVDADHFFFDMYVSEPRSQHASLGH